MSFFNKSHLAKGRESHLDESSAGKEKNGIKKDSDKKLLLNNKPENKNNNIINNQNKMIGEKRIKNVGNSENKNCFVNKKEGKSSSNFNINILNKPFFCCLKPC